MMHVIALSHLVLDTEKLKKEFPVAQEVYNYLLFAGCDEIEDLSFYNESGDIEKFKNTLDLSDEEAVEFLKEWTQLSKEFEDKYGVTLCFNKHEEQMLSDGIDGVFFYVKNTDVAPLNEKGVKLSKELDMKEAFRSLQ